MAEQTRTFRRIYVAQPGHDFTALMQYTGEVKFITTGLERSEQLERVIAESLQDFNPDEDAVVAVGRSNTSLVLGVVLAQMFRGKVVSYGVYRSKVTEEEEYVWLSQMMA